MIGPACEERGADLFEAARGGAPPADLARHLDACEGCRAEFERLRRLAAELPAASAGLAPRPGTRALILRTAEGAPEAPPPPPRLLRRGPMLPVWAPYALVAAGVAAMLLVMARPRPVPLVEPTSGGVSVTTLWGVAVVEGPIPGDLRPGAELAASEVSSVRLGAPLDADAVLAEGTRLRIPPGKEGARTLVLAAGSVYLEPSTPGSAPLLVKVGEVEVESRGARLSVERRADGGVGVVVESGAAAVRAAGKEALLSGPSRVDCPASGPPGEALPAESADAAAWFAYPVVTLEKRPSTVLGATDLVITLRPSVPRRLRIAPWDRFDPLFSLRATRPDGALTEVPVLAALLRRPAPGAESDGAFLLEPEKPYRIHLDPGALGLPPGRVRLEAVYSAGRPGGLWRGTRASNPMEFEVK